LLVFIKEPVQLFLGHFSHRYQEISDAVSSHLIDVHNRLVGLSLGAENGIFQRKMGLLKEPDIRPHKDNVVGQEKIEKDSDSSPKNGLFDSLTHSLSDTLS
jgi:hypothetical protein